MRLSFTNHVSIRKLSFLYPNISDVNLVRKITFTSMFIALKGTHGDTHPRDAGENLDVSWV